MSQSRMVGFLIPAAVLGPVCRLGAPLEAGPADWPGWRGADRSGVSPETGLLKEWPKDGPPLLWKETGLGIGYSTASVANGRLFVLGTRGSDEYVFALDVTDGKKVGESRSRWSRPRRPGTRRKGGSTSPVAAAITPGRTRSSPTAGSTCATTTCCSVTT